MNINALQASIWRTGGHRTVGRDAIHAQFALAGGTPAVSLAIDQLLLKGLPSNNDLIDPAEAMNHAVLQGLCDPEAFWRKHCVETGRLMVRALAGAPERHAALAPQRFAVDFSRTFEIASEGSRLRLPGPVEDAHLSGLSVISAGQASPGRVDFRNDGSTIEARFVFDARPGLPHHGGDPFAPIWLAENEGPIVVTPRVRALAETVAGNLPASEAVMAFRAYLLDNFACGIVHADRIGDLPATDWVLETGWFDCRLGAALLVALCRARGIAARLIGGYLLWAAPMEHYWMEAWISGQGWTPFDLLSWDLAAGGRDPVWRDVYAGALDYRMKTQIFPHIFTGSPGIPMPAGIHRLPRAISNGVEMRVVAAKDGQPLYTDKVRIL